MKFRCVALTLAVVLMAGCGVGTKPSVQEVEPALRTYLTVKKTCSGTVTVDQLTVTSVGDYDKSLKGWPVYALFAVTCRQGADTDTWDGRGGSPDAAAAWARRTASGNVECFTPNVFIQGEKELKQQLEKATQEMFNKTK